MEVFFTERGIQHSLQQSNLQLRITVDVSLSDQAVNVTEKRIRDLREGLTTYSTRHVTEPNL